MPNYLFNTYPFREFVDQRTRDIANHANGFDPEDLLMKPLGDLADIIVAHTKIEIPVLRRDREVLSEPSEVYMEMQDYGELVRVPAMRLTLTIPFEGQARFFDYQPNSSYSVPPVGQIVGDKLVLSLVAQEVGPEMRKVFEKNIEEIEQYLEWQRSMVASHNSGLESNALKLLEQRKTKLLHARSMAASIGYNMKPALPIPTTHRALQIQRKPTPVGRKPASPSQFVSEPELIEDDYQHILGVIEAMSHVMERSPRAFVELGEEDLRQHLLVPLNGHYKGDGTAEAFNNKGKTDILVRVEDKNIFVAECKVWGGDKVCKDAIDQLLGYLTWRDTKTCLIMFSHLKDFSYMLNQYWKSIEEHPNFKKLQRVEGETRRRYVFRNAYDPDRELILTALAFNIPRD